MLDKKDFDGAVAAHKEAIRLDPNDAGAHAGLGNALRAKNDDAGAIAAYQEAIRLKHFWVMTYVRLGSLLNKQGEPFAALKVLREGAALNPVWMTVPNYLIRYNSACYAILAGTGQGRDAPPEPERPALRKEALAWLTADLATWRTMLGEARTKPLVQREMTHWLHDPDLAGVRAEQLKGLPADEIGSWQQFWADVRRLRLDAAPQRIGPAYAGSEREP